MRRGIAQQLGEEKIILETDKRTWCWIIGEFMIKYNFDIRKLIKEVKK